MITTKGPNGPVILKVRVHTRGCRTGTQTTDPGVDAAIGKLDRRGHWWWLREAALWQDPAMRMPLAKITWRLLEIGAILESSTGEVGRW